jgi:hypothetical protein
VVITVSQLEQISVENLESLVGDSRDMVVLPDEKFDKALLVRCSARFPVLFEVRS